MAKGSTLKPDYLKPSETVKGITVPGTTEVKNETLSVVDQGIDFQPAGVTVKTQHGYKS